MSDAPLPSACDVLVVGAGPAGSACAQMLARAGLHTVLADQHDFPRDKVCGDGLIPDAHAALRRLGVYDEVMASAQPARHVACIGPRGGRVDVPGTVAVLPRRQLDHILVRAAQRAGAALHTPWRFEAPRIEAERVTGARLKSGNRAHELSARWVVLATGAPPQAMLAAGLCQRRTPTGIALRGYVGNEAMVGRIRALEIVWHKRLKHGYGWIFPCPGGVFNIGVGLADCFSLAGSQRLRMQDVNLRDVFQAFCEVYAPARELMAGGTMAGELKGAPLRCSLDGALYSRAGMLATGEAIGSTYDFSGEGIGKAMHTGMLAAAAIAKGHQQQLADDAVRGEYEASIRALQPRFELYRKASRVNAHPWLADLVIWRARNSERILRRMSGVLEETANPGNLVSARGIAKLFLPIR
ncbi:MAG TPA: geranylgeranyl reductase family protein [Rubrivivax sp.]|nr:geranylgeranyl reductase family protein [Rubrivivax sp.]HPO19391.1 geranylgeranyl reductase family protein [Rubrivivax sp.]